MSSLEGEEYRAPAASGLARAALVVMGATLVSRLIGFVREMLMAHYFGAGAQMGAYRAAYILPNIFRDLLADVAISSAFIPVFSAYLGKGDRRNAWEVASTVINLMILILGAVTALGMVFTPQLVPLVAPGYVAKPATFGYTVILARIVFMALVFMGLSGVIMGILNSQGHFSAPALAPVIFNIFIILGIVFLAPKMGIISLALGVVAGSVAQLIFQIPYLRRYGWGYRFRLNLKHPGVRQVGALLIPVMISLGASEINITIDTRFASEIGESAVAALGYAIRLWTLPLGMFAIAISTVLFPTFARQADSGDIDDLRSTLSLGLRMVFLILLPAMAGFLALTTPIVRLIFERGAFTPEATSLTSTALFYYTFGLFAAGALYQVNRVFYSLKDSRTPMIVAVISIVANYIGDSYLTVYLPVWVGSLDLPSSLSWLGFPHGGIALTTALVSILNLTVLLVLLRRRIGRIEGKRLAYGFLKMSAASILLGASALMVSNYVRSLLGLTLIGQLSSVFLAIIVGATVYWLAAKLFRVEEISTLRELLAKRFQERPNVA